jgi:hypothetical protein
MLEQSELEWLAAERPAPLHLDAETTARVRTELLAHAADPSSQTRVRSSRPLALRLLGRRPLRIAISATVLGAVAFAALATSGSTSKQPSSGLGGLVSVQPAAAAPLVRLSVKLAAAPPPAGDATLVLRRQVYPNSPAVDGADLYADNGNYYYATSLSGLPAAIAAGDTVNTGASDQEVRDIAAAQAALTGPIEAARQQMSIANLDPGVTPRTLTPQTPNDLQPDMSQENNMIWNNSMDALLAGAGNPQVRAGVLKLLATIPQITTTQGTLDGQPTLVLTADVLSSNSDTDQEQLIVNATTGVPVQFVDGNVGQTPDVTVYYTISRVTVSSIENGTNSGA